MQIPQLKRIGVQAALCLGLLIGFTLPPRTVWPASLSTRQAAPSAEYMTALQTANGFLWAWLNRDAERGLRLISDQLRREIKDDSWLRQFMIGLSNPHHQAFEIGRGKKKSADVFVFPVTLYELASGERTGNAYSGALEISKEGDSWRVTLLPASPENR